MTTVVVLKPPPRFEEIKRERGLQKSIWVVKEHCGTFVGRSVPAICRELRKRGGPACPSAIYRPNQTFRASYRCKDAEEVNRALAGEDEATFIVAEPGRWIIDAQKENATVVSGDSSAA
jgi:hypothetical protein